MAMSDDFENDNLYYYAAIYVAYFCGIILLSVFLDRNGFADKTMMKLGQSAHTAFMKYEYPKLNKNYNDPEKVPGCCSNTKKVAPAPSGGEVEAVVDYSIRAFCITWCVGKKIAEVEYNPLFIKKLLSRAAYWGIADGLTGCWKWQYGILSDYVFVVFNQHTFLSLFCASKRGRLARKERRHAFIVQHCLAFFMASALAGSLDNAVERLVVNMFVIVPICLMVNTLYIFLLTCPCLIREWQWCCCQMIADCLSKAGRVVAFPFVMIAVCLLLLAAAYTVGDNFSAVIKYAYQVHCLSIVQELVLLSCMFRYNTYTRYKCFGITVFEFGTWFKEQCMIFDLSEENGDYTVKELKLGRFSVTQWTRKPGLVRPAPLDGDVEMGDMQQRPNENNKDNAAAGGGEQGTAIGKKKDDAAVTAFNGDGSMERDDDGAGNTCDEMVMVSPGSGGGTTAPGSGMYVPVALDVPKTDEVQPATDADGEVNAGPGLIDRLKGTNKVGIEPTVDH